mmetsp:Transcript_79547/g.221327  ORF Transcript_79547/g.221327 Transcript_79547/m.221327 type:complete len:537 (-) Transcript_79547:195-1805(-)
MSEFITLRCRHLLIVFVPWTLLLPCPRATTPPGSQLQEDNARAINGRGRSTRRGTDPWFRREGKVLDAAVPSAVGSPATPSDAKRPQSAGSRTGGDEGNSVDAKDPTANVHGAAAQHPDATQQPLLAVASLPAGIRFAIAQLTLPHDDVPAQALGGDERVEPRHGLPDRVRRAAQGAPLTQEPEVRQALQAKNKVTPPESAEVAYGPRRKDRRNHETIEAPGALGIGQVRPPPHLNVSAYIQHIAVVLCIGLMVVCYHITWRHTQVVRNATDTSARLTTKPWPYTRAAAAAMSSDSNKMLVLIGFVLAPMCQHVLAVRYSTSPFIRSFSLGGFYALNAVQGLIVLGVRQWIHWTRTRICRTQLLVPRLSVDDSIGIDRRWALVTRALFFPAACVAPLAPHCFWELVLIEVGGVTLAASLAASWFVFPTVKDWRMSGCGRAHPENSITRAMKASDACEDSSLPSAHVALAVFGACLLQPVMSRWTWAFPVFVAVSCVRCGDHNILDTIAGAACGFVHWWIFAYTSGIGTPGICSAGR